MNNSVELKYEVCYDLKANFYYNLCGGLYISYSVCYVDITEPLLMIVQTVPESVEICRFFGICQKRWENGVDLEAVKRGMQKLQETRMAEIDLLYSVGDERGVERFTEIFEHILKLETQVEECEEVAVSQNGAKVCGERQDELETIKLMKKLVTIKVDQLDQAPISSVVRAQNALLRSGITNFLMLLCKGPKLKVRNLGRKSQEKLEEIMEYYGVSWSDKERLDMTKIPIKFLLEMIPYSLYSWSDDNLEAFRKAKIRLTGDIIKYTSEELRNMLNFTEKKVDIIECALGEVGLFLKGSNTLLTE